MFSLQNAGLIRCAVISGLFSQVGSILNFFLKIRMPAYLLLVRKNLTTTRYHVLVFKSLFDMNVRLCINIVSFIELLTLGLFSFIVLSRTVLKNRKFSSPVISQFCIVQHFISRINQPFSHPF